MSHVFGGVLLARGWCMGTSKRCPECREVFTCGEYRDKTRAPDVCKQICQILIRSTAARATEIKDLDDDTI